MTQKHFGLGRQSQHFMNRPVQRMGVTARKIRARRTYIRHKKCVSHKNDVLNPVGHVCRCVARHQHGHGFHVAYLEDLTVFEKVVKLTAIGCKIGIEIKHGLESGLHRTNVFTNRDSPANALFQVLRT